MTEHKILIPKISDYTLIKLNILSTDTESYFITTAMQYLPIICHVLDQILTFNW